MSDLPTRIPAIHDWHLRRVLDELGLLPALEAGEIRCFACESRLTLDAVGGILVRGQGAFALVCSRAECLRGRATLE